MAGVHFLPIPRSSRVIAAVIYTPVAGYLILISALAAGCGWNGACP
jgi:hypothetical protein